MYHFPSKRSVRFCLVISIFLVACNTQDGMAQRKKQKKKEAVAQAAIVPEKKCNYKKVAEATKSARKIPGLFTLYQDTISGSVSMLVRQAQVGQEFIHFYYVENGAVEAGSFRGQFRGSKVFTIARYFNRLEFIEENTSSYFDPANPLSKAADANITHSLMYCGKIIAGSEEEGQYLIEADNLFLQEELGSVKPSFLASFNPFGFKLGSLSGNKTKYLKLKNYPANTDVVVEYVFDNSTAINQGSRAVTDARHVSIQVQHTLLAMPANDYEVRIDDPRVGYFSTQVTDMTSREATPYRDVIHRWNLRKKDPAAPLSEPVKPIVFWIENTTPYEIRDIIRKAGETWNESFERIGFKDAIQIKQQPDDATWDAGDMRYNVLRWASSPNPPFGGYGPSFINPRTGEILGADIMLEYAALGSNLRNEKIFAREGLDMYLEEASQQTMNDQHLCSAGLQGLIGNLFGTTALQTFSDQQVEQNKMTNEFLSYLILHEMGHTLGLNHNMKSSQLHAPKNINNVELTSKIGLVGSVMDYPEINFALNRKIQGQYWPTKPGPYDFWAIEFGYRPYDEKEREALLGRSTEPALSFGNDADDMRNPGKGIDPRVNVNDLTSDAITFALERLRLTQKVAEELLGKYQKPGQSYQELRNSYLVLTTQQTRAVNTISRYIGGVYVDRAFVGQEGATKPFVPVSLTRQKRAMNALAKHVFAPDAFAVPAELYSYLQMQRRGFDFQNKHEDPQIHDRVLNIQKSVLCHLLHPDVLTRISDSELYGNDYSLAAMMTDLNAAIFSADMQGNVNSFRQNLQAEYVEDLISIVSKDKYPHTARAMAIYNLRAIRHMSGSRTGDTATRAHRQRLNYLITKALQVEDAQSSSVVLD